MSVTKQDANYSIGGMIETPQDANYFTGGMHETIQVANYSIGGMLVLSFSPMQLLLCRCLKLFQVPIIPPEICWKPCHGVIRTLNISQHRPSVNVISILSGFQHPSSWVVTIISSFYHPNDGVPSNKHQLVVNSIPPMNY